MVTYPPCCEKGPFQVRKQHVEAMAVKTGQKTSTYVTSSAATDVLFCWRADRNRINITHATFDLIFKFSCHDKGKKIYNFHMSNFQQKQVNCCMYIFNFCSCLESMLYLSNFCTEIGSWKKKVWNIITMQDV